MAAVLAGHATSSRRIDWLLYLPVIVALCGIWALLAIYTVAERRNALERVQTQLGSIVATLADFSELADSPDSSVNDARSASRGAAIWRALLQYPSAGIWVESGGVVTAGVVVQGAPGAMLVATDRRNGFTVHASMLQADALVQWRRDAWQRAAVVAGVSLAFLLVTGFLGHSLKRRSKAERETAAAQERVTQLAQNRAQLEDTVTERTMQLEKQLVEREATETALREHDELLHVVTRSAAALLGSNHETAINVVLELIGNTIAASRVQFNATRTGQDGHLHSSLKYEWRAAGMVSLLERPELQDLDLTTTFPRTIAPTLAGVMTTIFIEDVAEPYRSLFLGAGMRSFLRIPVLAAGQLWGILFFIDSRALKREWSWAETDTLKTLAGLIGAAKAQAQQIKELSDANIIVQNSPTILLRLRGEPPFPLIYISRNVSKFGHNAKTLMASAIWSGTFIEAEDKPRVAAALTGMQAKDSPGATVEFRLLTGNGGSRWVETRYTPVRDASGRLIEIEGIVNDITERRAADEKIALLARTDGLTGLANRVTFMDRLRQGFASAKRGASPFAVLYLDLDHFKEVNDTLGHPVGDALLREVADRLRSIVRASDVAARLGGDEFAILQFDMGEPANAGYLAAKIQKSLALPYVINGSDAHISVSIGICPYADNSTGPDAMLAQADVALYRSKSEGRNQYHFHTDDLDQEVLARVTLAAELNQAIREDQLELHYQPQVEIVSGKIVGMEALVRWNHPTRGLLGPGAFLPVAEKTGSIMALGRWVLNHACYQMKLWREQGIAPPVVAVNLSLAQLKNSRDLVDDVTQAAARWKVPISMLEFDVTEATLARVTLTRNDVLTRLRDLGAKVAIDDFGTEYSSFDYLRAYGVSHLKIAQSYINEAISNPERAATIRAIISLARELGIGVIAEGIETQEQRALLASTGSTTQAQGYFFSPAVDAAASGEMLRLGFVTPRDDSGPVTTLKAG